MTANTEIIDVGVDIVPNTPGTVIVYPLLEDGSVTPTAVLNQVDAILDDDYVRPLTDTVIVTAPTQVTYTLAIGLVLYEDADPTDVLDAVEAAVTAYTVAQRQSMGRDVMEDQIIAACVNAIPNTVYDVDLGAFTDIVIGSNEYGYCTSITVTITGTNEG